MNIMNQIQQYAEQIGGQFTHYDSSRSIIVIPLNDGRYQSVLISIQKSAVSKKEQLALSSKICEFNSELNLKQLLEQNAHFDFSKFVLEEDYLKMESTCLLSSANEQQVKEMLQEVAQLADHYELQFTGADVH